MRPTGALDLRRRRREPPPADAGTLFDRRAQVYDGRYDEVSADGYALRSRLRAVLDSAGDGPGDALDAGMGGGRLAAELAGRGWTVSGVDAADRMVELARRRLPSARGRMHRALIESLPFPDESFDLVTATGVLEYSTVDASLRELRRVLRGGGRLVVSYPNPEAIYAFWKTRVWYPGARTAKRMLGWKPHSFKTGGGRFVPREFEELLTQVGLAPAGFVYNAYMPLPTPLELLLPRAGAALGERLETRRPQWGRRLAGQVVYVARKEER